MLKKRLPNGEFFLWILCAGAVLTSFLLPLSALPEESLCWFYNLTHIPCPGCGLTRAFICISHGQWHQAAQFNPFGFVWYLMALYGSLRPLLSSYFSSLSRSVDRLIKANFFFPSLAVVMVVVWGWRICF